MNNQETVKSVLQLMANCSLGDISVLEAALGKPSDSVMMTMPGSANDRLWSQMEKLGWLRIKNDDVKNLPDGINMTSRLASITEDGLNPISELLKTYRQQLEKMIKIYNEVSLPFINQLVIKIRDEGGTIEDIVKQLSLIVERGIRSSFSTLDHAKASKTIYQNVRQRLNLKDFN